MRIAYREISACISAALEQRGLSARIALQAIEPPRPWGVTCNACFTLGAQHAAGAIEAATSGLDKKAAKELAGKLAREAGVQLAAEVAAELERCRTEGLLTQYVERVEAEGAYLNFYYNGAALAGLVIAVAGLDDYTPDDNTDNFGSGTVPEDGRKQIMVEYAQPNTHKDFHVGHLRNASIGQAIANLLEFAGHTVYKATYLGDVGAHVAKAIWGASNRGPEHFYYFYRIKNVFLSELLPILDDGPDQYQVVASDPTSTYLRAATRLELFCDGDMREIDLPEGYSLHPEVLSKRKDYTPEMFQKALGLMERDRLAYWGGIYQFSSVFLAELQDLGDYLDKYAAKFPQTALGRELNQLGWRVNKLNTHIQDGMGLWFKAWEQEENPSHHPVREQWQTSRDECIAAFKSIFAELLVDFHHDCWFYESEVDDSHLGQKTAAELKERGIAVVDESEEYKGALYVDFAAQADAVKSTGTEACATGTPSVINEEGTNATSESFSGAGVPACHSPEEEKSTGTGARATETPANEVEEPVFTDAEKKRIRQLGKMTILRSNGTSLYQTKELGLAKYKFDWVKQQTGRDLDESLYVVGAEQKLYFEQVFAILRLWGFPNADKCKHIAYELVVLPEGKMSSREGTVVSYRELRDAAVAQATEIIKEKGLITDEAQIAETAKSIAIAAIKYTMLQVSGNQQIVFDFAQALSFDGRSAPYLQYAYARAGKLVAGTASHSATSEGLSGAGVPARHSSSETDTDEKSAGTQACATGTPLTPVTELHPSEIALARLLSQFPETCQTAAERYEPAILCNYLYACADAFSAFYRDCRVLGVPDATREFRQGLTRAFRRVMRTGFDVLALPLPETM